jgi:hypothetical protein
VVGQDEKALGAYVMGAKDATGDRPLPPAASTPVGVERLAWDQLLQGLLARDARTVLAEYSDVVERSVTAWRDLVQSAVQHGVAAGEVRSDLPTSAIVDAVTELHLAYAERVVAGQDAESNQRNGEVAFECLLHGLCVPIPSSTGENRDG